MRRIEEEPHCDSSSPPSVPAIGIVVFQPGRDQQSDTLPVDGFVGSVAEADADDGPSDAHGERD